MINFIMLEAIIRNLKSNSLKFMVLNYESNSLKTEFVHKRYQIEKMFLGKRLDEYTIFFFLVVRERDPINFILIVYKTEKTRIVLVFFYKLTKI